jgi:uroporphyrinogen decarboxylase
MTSKERIIAMLEHREADKVPRGENAFDSIFCEKVTGKKTLCNAGWEELEALWAGRRDEVVRDYIDATCLVAEALGWDYVRVPAAPKKKDYSGYKRIDQNVFQDGESVKYHYNPVVGNIVTPYEYKVDMTVAELGAIDAPFSVDDSEMDIARGVAERIGKTHFIIGRSPVGDSLPYLDTVGLEELMVRMITDPEFVETAGKIACRKSIRYAEAFLRAGCDGFMVTDDYADTRGLLMGKERYHRFIEPRLRELCTAVHDAGGYFIKHTDGVMWDALDSFADMGIDGWHGIQPSLGMDIRLLKEKYRGKLCFFGGVNVETMIEGTEEDIRNEVRHALEYGAPGGGLVVTCGNILEPGAKPENYRVIIEEIERNGTYPIK